MNKYRKDGEVEDNTCSRVLGLLRAALFWLQTQQSRAPDFFGFESASINDRSFKRTASELNNSRLLDRFP